MNLYRIYPTLWNDGMCSMAQTVYAIDRQPPSPLKVACSSHPKEDPISFWESQTFFRILPPEDQGPKASVSWAKLPSWISYALQNGYTLQGDLSRLKPYSDIYIMGP